MAVVSIAVVSIAVVNIAVVSIAVVKIAVVSIVAASIAEPHHVCGSSALISSCHAAPVRHVMRLQSSIVVFSIVVVSIETISIAEPHHVMQLHCWVGLKQKFSFSYFCKKFLLASKTHIYLNTSLHSKRL
jgi:hypothetical protein